MLRKLRRWLFNVRKKQWKDPAIDRYSLYGFREWVRVYEEYTPDVSVDELQQTFTGLRLNHVGELLSEFTKYLECLESGSRYDAHTSLHAPRETSRTLYRYYLSPTREAYDVVDAQQQLYAVVKQCVNHPVFKGANGHPFRQGSLLWQELTRYIDHVSAWS